MDEIRIPTREEVAALAAEFGLGADAEEIETWHRVVAGVAQAFAHVGAEPDALPEPVPPVAERRWWTPPPEENPLGAWHARCEIRLRDEGPLAGRAVALKDNVMLAGLPLLNGCRLLEGYRAEIDATLVVRLLQAGAVIAGKAHCENLSMSAASHTCAAGPVRNPHARDRTAGGSSSGSAALVGAGEVDLAIGADQGGSIRVPAAYCGACGLKPTHGLVPYTGVVPVDPSFDHVGPITATVRDNALLLGVIAGPDGIDARQNGAPAGDYTGRLDDGADGLRIGLLTEGFTGVEPAMADAVRAAAERFEGLGASVRNVSVPEHDAVKAHTVPLVIQGTWYGMQRDGHGVGRSDLYPPGFLARMRGWRHDPRALPPTGLLVALLGRWADDAYGVALYGKAHRLARRARAAFDAALAELDVLLMPTTHTVAPPLGSVDAPFLEQIARCAFGVANTQPFDVTHHPALTIPCGRIEGLPAGMMLVGRHHDEATLYRAAHAWEQSTDWRSG